MFRVRAARTGLARAAAHRSSLLGRSEQIRPIAAVAMRGGAGVVGLLTAYVSFQVWQRLEWNQRRRIAARLKSPAKELSNFKTGPLWLQRHEKHAFISDLCNSDPGGPLLITGPRGTGKSMILRKAFSGRPGVAYHNLRSTPVTTAEGLTVNLITQCGYLLPPNELLGRAVFNRTAERGPTDPVDIDRGLRLISEVLHAEKARGWTVRAPDGTVRVVPPLLCIDELNFSEVASDLLDDAAFWRLLDWLMHIADNRLAHVVLCAGLDAAELLDRYPGFRARRQRVFIDFPRDSTVDFYFHRVVNPFLRDMLGAVPRPAPPKLPLPPVGAARQPASSSAGSLPVGPAAEGVEDSPNRQPVRAVAEVARPLALPRRSGSWMEWWRGSSSGGDATSLLSDHSRSGLHSETKLPQSAEPSVVVPSAAVLPQAEKESLDFLGDVEQTPTAASKVRETLKDTVKAPSLASPELQVERNLASSLALSPTKESALALDTTSIGVVSGEGQPPAIAAPPQPAPILAAVPALLKGDALPQPLPPAADPSTEQLSAPGAATAMPVAAARAAIRAQQAAAAAAAAQKSQQTNASDPSQVPRPASTVDVYAADSSVPVLEAEAATGAAAAPLSQAAASTPPHGKLPSAFSSHSGTAALPKVCGGPEGVGLVDASQSSVPNRRLSGAGASAVLHRPRDMVSVDTAAIFGNGPAGEVTDDIFLLTPEEIATIVATVGGHLQDLLTVVTAVTRGQSWGEALERLVADSAEAVEHILDAILDVPGGVAAGGAAVAAQAAGRRNTRSGSAGFASGLPAHDFQTHPGPARLAAYGRYARAWALLSALGDRRYVSRRELTTLIFPACPHELDYLVASGLVTSLNAKSDARVDSPSTFAQLQANHPGEYITAASPRLRVAFRVVTRDARLRVQTARILAALSVAALRAEETELSQRLPEVVAERAYALQLLQARHEEGEALLARDTALRSTVIKEQLLVAPAGSPAASGDAPASSGSVHVPASLSRLSEGEPPLGMAGLAAATAAANDRLASLEREVDRLRAALEKTRAELSSALAVAAEPSHTAAVDALAPPSVSSNMAMPLSVQNLPGDDGASAWPPLEDVSKPPGVDGAAGVDRGTGYEAFIGISGEPPSEKSMAPPPAAAAWTWLLGTPPPSSPSNSQAFAYPGSTGGDASRMQGANAAAFEPGPGAQWRYGRGGEDSSGGDGGSSKNVGAFSPPPKPTLSAAAEAQLSGSWIPYSIGRGGAWERSGTAPMATAAESRWTPPAPLQPSYYGGPSLPASPAPSSPAAASSTTTAESGAPARRRWRYRRYLNAPDGGGGDAAAGQGGGGALGGPASAGGLGGGGGGSPSEGEGREGGGAPGSSGGASEGRGEWHGSDSAGGYRWWL